MSTLTCEVPLWSTHALGRSYSLDTRKSEPLWMYCAATSASFPQAFTRTHNV
jgi:hypothetical protein